MTIKHGNLYCRKGLKPKRQVVRGGSWNNNPENLRVCNRNNNNPNNRNSNIGVRLVNALTSQNLLVPKTRGVRSK